MNFRLSQAARLLVVGFALASQSCSSPQVAVTPAYEGQLQLFDHDQVTITGGPFLEAQQADMNYILAMDVDRLLAPYLIDAGLPTEAVPYTNWENTGLNGHIGGHYLSALSLMYAATGNEELLARINYMVDQLAQCQQANGNGYVGGVPDSHQMWEDIKAGKIDAGSFSLNGKWVPLYNIHKIYAGLRDAYLIAGNEQAKTILIGLTDWMLDVTQNLSDEQIQDMLRSEYGGLNETFADVAAITGEHKYLKLAEQFSHRVVLDPLLEQKDVLTGMHANTQIPKVIGFERIAKLNENTEWRDAADFFWKTVVENRTVSIGGNSVREHFHPADDFTPMINSEQGPETCNTYNMLRLTEMLFCDKPDEKYMDYYERGMFNHILSSQHPDGGFVYFTPMRPRHYRVYSQPQLGFWCCVGSGLENHGKYNEMVFAYAENELFVNLFVDAKLDWEAKGITVNQATNLPEEGYSKLTIETKAPTAFGLNLRFPDWVVAGGFEVLVNGSAIAINAKEGSYFRLERTWENGDVIELKMPMAIQVEQMPDGSDYVSIKKGPYVMAAKTDTTDLDGLWADDSRMAHVAQGEMYPLDQAPTIIAEDGKEILNELTADAKGLTIAAAALEANNDAAMQLVPFYQVHEARYMVYFPMMSAEVYEEQLAKIKAEEEALLALERQTLDQIATGEQQPESDHGFKGERTNSGINGEVFWRDAAGWFSYVLKNKDQAAKTLRIQYFGGDAGRHFKILLNDQLFQKVTLESGKFGFYEIDYPIDPTFFGDSEKLKIKFEADEGSTAGGIYYIRLLK